MLPLRDMAGVCNYTIVVVVIIESKTNFYEDRIPSTNAQLTAFTVRKYGICKP